MSQARQLICRIGLMARYGEIYEAQQRINDAAVSVYAELQSATSVLNTETPDQGGEEGERMDREAESADARSRLLSAPDSRSDAAENEVNSRLSGHQDLSRLTPEEIDRLEQGFQQAITDDRRLHRLYINLGVLYASLPR